MQLLSASETALKRGKFYEPPLENISLNNYRTTYRYTWEPTAKCDKIIST